MLTIGAIFSKEHSFVKCCILRSSNSVKFPEVFSCDIKRNHCLQIDLNIRCSFVRFSFQLTFCGIISN